MKDIKAFFQSNSKHAFIKLRKLAFMTYGKRLEQAIALAKKDRAALADAMGVTVQSIGQTIRGETKAHTAENCARAARFLGVDMFWLATGDGEPRPELPLAAEREALSVDAVQHAMAYDNLSEAQRQIWRAILLTVSSAAAVPEQPKEPAEDESRYKAARAAVQALSDEDRLALFAAIQQPGLLDHEVEIKIPATKKAPRRKSNFNLENPQEHHGSNDVHGIQEKEDAGSSGRGRRTGAKR